MLIVAFISIGWGLDQLYSSFTERAEKTSDLELHKGTLFLLNRELARLPAELHKDHTKALSNSFGYPVSLAPLQEVDKLLHNNGAALTHDQRDFLQKSGVVSVFHNDSQQGWFMQKLTDHDSVLILGPVQHYDGQKDSELYSLVLFVALAVVVFIWVWPLSQSLLQLTKTAQQFGSGDFDARVPHSVTRPLKDLSYRFNDMAARIQRLIQSHKDLSHAVSHELRTPIARIRFAVEMAKDTPNQQKRDSYFGTIDQNIEELDNLVEELLVYARFDREEPELQCQNTQLDDLCESLLKRTQQTESHLQFKLNTPEELPLICIDKNAITRVLDNLLRNACRYAKQYISLSLTPTNTGMTIKVEDDGPGIPEEARIKLFEPFYRLDKSRDKKSGGIGLGLAIVKKLVELHQGNVKIESSTLGGACFTITLPSHLKKDSRN